MFKLKFHFIFYFGIAIILNTSCENNIEVVKSISNSSDSAEVACDQVEILYSDSAQLKVRVVTKELNRYRKSGVEPYIEFPKGMHVYFYDENKNVNAEVSCRYAIYKESTRIWEARDDVMVENVKGDVLNTEQLFWDENKAIIYTNVYAKVTQKDGDVSIGERGLTAKQDFSSWRFIGASGKMKFREDEP